MGKPGQSKGRPVDTGTYSSIIVNLCLKLLDCYRFLIFSEMRLHDMVRVTSRFGLSKVLASVMGYPGADKEFRRLANGGPSEFRGAGSVAYLATKGSSKTVALWQCGNHMHMHCQTSKPQTPRLSTEALPKAPKCTTHDPREEASNRARSPPPVSLALRKRDRSTNQFAVVRIQGTLNLKP